MVTALRRLFWLAALGGAGFAGWSLWTSSRRTATTGAAPQPPRASAAPQPLVAPVEPAASGTEAAPAGEASDSAPDPQAFVAVAEWVAPVDGACPASHPVKANDNSGIFHVPGGRFYDRTRPERCYATPEAATADGYRAAKS